MTILIWIIQLFFVPVISPLIIGVIKKIKAKKYKTDLIRKIINGKDLNIVMVGSYKSLDEAIKAQNRINKEFKVDGKIIKLAE